MQDGHPRKERRLAEGSARPDPFELRRLYKYLRVVDVCDAMDGLGYFDRGLMSPEIRPL